MPLQRYGVLKGQAVAARPGTANPHYQIHLVDNDTSYRIAVNVRSQLSPPDVLYFVDENFRHPLTAGLSKLDAGYHKLASKPGGLALDYIRGNLFDTRKLKPLPANVSGPDNDLNDLVEKYVKRAMNEEKATVYAFGDRWGPENKPDRYFGFRPGNGIHDIHMNQGNSGRFASDNGVYQDGGLLFHFPAENRWVAVFLAFQSQKFHSNDESGDGFDPGLDTSLSAIHIVAALVNPRGDDTGKETVTLLNASDQPVNLQGWSLADQLKHKRPLDATVLPAGSMLTIPLDGSDVQLSNDGGIITLLDKRGIKVDGVSYTRQTADREGWTIVF